MNRVYELTEGKLVNEYNMANSWFRFKQFTVWHNQCAMKVGTDGVLLGAWAKPGKSQKILDIGTGTGLLALMLAQKCEGQITAIDRDALACKQARENINQSPWNNRIFVDHTSILSFAEKKEEMFDYIICNPPFFHNSMHAPVECRSKARHSEFMSRTDLFSSVSHLLEAKGFFGIIIPYDDWKSCAEKGIDNGLHIRRALKIKPTPSHPPKRMLLEFCRMEVPYQEDCLVIEQNGRHQYSAQYRELTKDYYLNF